MSAHRETLRADNIVKRFGAVTALDGVSLTLRQGEILGILGDNGAGKSTLMKILTGYQAPSTRTAVRAMAGRWRCVRWIMRAHWGSSAFIRIWRWRIRSASITTCS